MRVSGFTIVRQTVSLGYPFVESIRSLLPLVDELVVAVGDSDDGTWEAVQAIGDAKLRAFHTRWDPLLRAHGEVLREQTNLALSRCTGDWAVYLQADEVLHEDDLEPLRASLKRHLERRTEALLFRYLHFFGCYGVVGDDWRIWYPRAVRAVKTGRGVVSAGDACGFHVRREGFTRGTLKANAHARIFHYGWCGPAATLAAKQRNLERLYRDDIWIAAREGRGTDVVANRRLALKSFRGVHPGVMRERIAAEERIVDRATGQARADLVRPVPQRGRDFRPLLPITVTNAYWRAIDLWRGLRATGRATEPPGR